MAWRKKTLDETPEKTKEDAPFNPLPVKDALKLEDLCTVEGCTEKKAPGQTHVCVSHIRTN